MPQNGIPVKINVTYMGEALTLYALIPPGWGVYELSVKENGIFSVQACPAHRGRCPDPSYALPLSALRLLYDTDYPYPVVRADAIHNDLLQEALGIVLRRKPWGDKDIRLKLYCFAISLWLVRQGIEDF